MFKYLIIADDFTGANDTGVQIRRRGIPTNVVFNSKLINSEEASFVVDTESRGLTGTEAYETVKKVSSEIDFSKFKYVIKKVDSTLRGNIAEEIKAVDEEFKSELVIFAPALPDLSRTTLNGIHCLNGIHICETELSKDPKKPVIEDNIQKLLQSVYDEPVTHINIDNVRTNNIDMSHKRVYTFDAVTNHDMQTIISMVIKTGKRALWVGTAAMADNLFEIEKKTNPSLAIVGSVSSVTRGQIKYAENAGFTLLKIPVYDIIEKSNMYTYIEKAVELLKSGKDLIILSAASYNECEYNKTNEAGLAKGLSTEEISMLTQNILGDISRSVMEQVSVSGVFLTGGDTAMGFFEKAEALGSSIIGEVMIGIPLMKLRGGKFDGLNVITKAGAFGKEDTITYSLRKLKETF